MKQIIRILCAVACSIFFLFGVSACTTESENSSSGGDGRTLSLNVYNLSMAIGDEFSLIADYEPIEGAHTVFSSSNSTVARVDDYGRVIAENVGETVITVTYGDLSQNCSVSVGYDGMLAVLEFEEIVSDAVKVGKGEELNVGSYITFNTIKYTDAMITYEYSDSTIGGIKDGIFTPLKLGTTDITVSASWRGQENISTLTKTIQVTVVGVMEIVVNDGTTDFTMYNLPSLGGNEYHTSLEFVVTAREEGQEVAGEKVSVVVSKGADVVEYDEGRIQALKPGLATVTISVQDSLGTTYEETVDITVLTSVGDYQEEIVFSAYDGELPIEDIFGAKVDLISAVCDGETLKINGNKDGVLGLSTTKDGPTQKQITVYSDTQGWNCNLLVYSGIIDEASDLDMFHLGGARACPDGGFTEEDTFSGYYILANDIDCSDYVFGSGNGTNLKNPAGIGSKSMLNVGLTGLFDGQGYSITNFTPNGAGLLAAINGGTLKNISISSPGSYNQNGPFLCAMMRNATLQNVNLNAGKVSMYGTVGISKYILNSTFENCVFQAQVTGSNPYWGGLVFEISGSTFKDCYAISNLALSGTATKKYDASNQNDGAAGAAWVEGIKRYTTTDAMVADKANNDLSTFSASYWDVQLGFPVWRGHFDFTVEDGDGNTVLDKLYLEVGNEISFKISALGEEYCTPTLSVASGDDVVEIEGATLTAGKAGTAVVEIFWTADGKKYLVPVTVQVTVPIEDYTEKLLYSAKDGQFFNTQGKVVTVEDIFGMGATLTNATHTTDALTVTANRVFGLTTSGASAVETSIVLYTDRKALKINVNAYTLIIDEATDLDYFYLGKRAATGSEWTKDDVFAGYYVLVKNINCKNYVFGQAKEEEGVTPANLTNPSGIGTANLKNVGLTGTFDGQGYSITNFTPNGAGLFAAINGGTLKNISISSPSSINSGGGFLCTMMRNATLQNVNLNAGTMIIYGTVGISKYILDSTLKNCVFQASSGAERNWGGLVAAISGSTFENCYAIYNYALSAGLSPKYDASNQNDGSATGVTWLDGIKRYNKVSEIQADAANNDYSSFDATYWDLTSGMPVWKKKS